MAAKQTFRTPGLAAAPLALIAAAGLPTMMVVGAFMSASSSGTDTPVAVPGIPVGYPADRHPGARLAGKFAYMFFRRFFAGGRGNKVGAIA